MRPVPTVFLRLAFSDQLSIELGQYCSSTVSGFSISNLSTNICKVFTYTCGSWQQGNRKKHTHASGCEESGDLEKSHQYFRIIVAFFQVHPSRHSLTLAIVQFRCRFFIEYSIARIETCLDQGPEGTRTNRIVGTGCASCCDAYRSWRYPSLLRRISKTAEMLSRDSSAVVSRQADGRRRTHLGCGVWAVSWMAIERFSIWETFFAGVRIYNPKEVKFRCGRLAVM